MKAAVNTKIQILASWYFEWKDQPVTIWQLTVFKSWPFLFMCPPHWHITKPLFCNLQCALTNGQLTLPFTCGRASVAPSTTGRHLLPSASFHMNSVTLFSNTYGARVGAGGAESTKSTVGTIMVHTISVCFWMDESFITVMSQYVHFFSLHFFICFACSICISYVYICIVSDI